MATEQEVLRMLVRLVGDSSDLEATVKKATDAVIQGTQRIRAEVKKASLSDNLGKEAERIIQRNLTPQEKYEAGVKRLNQAFVGTEMTAEQANRELARLTQVYEKQQAKIDGTAEAQRKLNREMREAEKAKRRQAAYEERRIKQAERLQQAMEKEAANITRSNMTPQEKHHAATSRLNVLFGQTKMTAETFSRELAKLDAQLIKEQNALDGTTAAQERLNAMMKEGERITRSHQTASEAFRASKKNLQQLLGAGAISQKVYNAEIAKEREILRNNRNPELNKMIKEGAALTEKHMTATERHNRAQTRLNELYRRGIIDARTYKEETKELRMELAQVSSRTQKLATDLVFVGLNMTAMFGGLSYGLGRLIGGMVESSAKMQQTSIAFRVMIGDAEQAMETVAGLEDFAIRTPFSQDEVLAAGKTMITFGEQGEQLIRTLEFIGNAAAASGESFQLISLVFNQVRGVGKLLQQDFRQLSTRGILSLQDFVDAGVAPTTAAVQEMMTNGEITFDIFKKVFKGLSEEGGRFSGIMEAFQESTMGKYQVLAGQVMVFARSISDELIPTIDVLLDVGRATVDWFNNLGPGMKRTIAYTLAFTFGLTSLGLVLGTTVLVVGQLTHTFIVLRGAYIALAAAQPGLIAGLAATRAAIFSTTGAITALQFALGIGVVAWAGYIAYTQIIGPQLDAFKQKTEEIVNSLNRMNESLNQRRNSNITDMGDIEDIDAQRKALQEFIAFEEKRLEIQKEQAKRTGDAAREVGNTWGDLVAGGALSDRFEQQNEAVRNAMNDTASAIAEAKEQLKGLDSAEMLGGLLENVNKLKEELKFETATVGMDQMQVKLYELEQQIKNNRFGAAELKVAYEALEEVKEQVRLKEEAEARVEAQKAVEDYVEGLEKEIELARLSAVHGSEANAVYEKNIALLHAKDDIERQQIETAYERLKVQKEFIEKQKELDKLAESMLKGIETPEEKLTKDLENIEKLWNQGFGGRIDTPQKVKLITESLSKFGETLRKDMEPIQAYQEQLQILQDKLTAGDIDQAQFDSIVLKLQEDLDKANMKLKIKEVSFENNAIRRGSSEFNKAMSQLYYAQTTKGGPNLPMQGGNRPPVPPQQPPVPPPGGGQPPVPANEKSHKVLVNMAKGINRMVSLLENIETKGIILSEANIGGI